MKASVELCINKLSDVAAKSGLKANCEKSESELGELWTPGGLTDSRVSNGNGVLEGHRKIGKLIIPIYKMGDRSEWINYQGIPLLGLLGRVYAKMLRINWTKAGWYPVRFSWRP